MMNGIALDLQSLVSLALNYNIYSNHGYFPQEILPPKVISPRGVEEYAPNAHIHRSSCYLLGPTATVL
jgi:hypothetical protein